MTNTAKIGHGSKFYLGDAIAGPVSELAEILGVALPDDTAETVVATSMSSPGKRAQYIGGLIDSGEGEIAMNYAAGSPTDLRVRASFGQARPYKVTIPGISGAWAVSGTCIVIGYGRDIPIDDRMVATLRIKFTGGVRESVAIEPLIDADFAAGVYKINGVAVALADMFRLDYSGGYDATDMAVPLTLAQVIVPGVGLRATKQLNTSDKKSGATAVLSDAVTAMLNQLAGFTVVNSTVFDQVAASGPVAHADAQPLLYSGFQIQELDGYPVKYGQAWYQPSDHYFSGEVSEETDAAYNYSEQWNRVGGELGELFESYVVMDNDAAQYYSFDPGAVTTMPVGNTVHVPLPNPALDLSYIYITATSHYSTPAAKNGVSGRVTLPRVRIYPQAMPAGWLAPN